MNDTQTATFPNSLLKTRNRLALRFALFHRENPHIYEQLEKRALLLFGLGMTRISISLLVESLRYDVAKANGGKTFEISNNHRAYYARLLIHNNPALRGVITTRMLISETY